MKQLELDLNDERVIIWPTPIHEMFSLSYASYFCVPRLVLDAMPIPWQRAFTELVERLPHTATYAVNLRGEGGRFMQDDLADYRRGQIPPKMASEIEENFNGYG